MVESYVFSVVVGVCPDVCIYRKREFAFAFRERCRELASEVSLQLVNPSEWRLAACCGFFRDESIIILEARSILYAVRFAESCCPLGRLLILSDTLALVLALCEGRSTFFYVAFSRASYLLRLASVQVWSYLSGGNRQS